MKLRPGLGDRLWMRRHRAVLARGPLPAQVGLVMDGNRRWARAVGHADPSVGHRYGAEHLEDFLGWCERWGIDQATVYVLSADNIRKRTQGELGFLFHLLATTLPEAISRPGGRWALHLTGDTELLRADARLALEAAVATCTGRPAHLTLAIGYDGRRDIVAGVRRALRTATGDGVTVADISAALPGGPVKEIDLVIRTSGEVRLSGFFPWQSAHAEFYVSAKMWPAFTEVDFARALAHFARKRSAPA